ncbi:MAG: amino acid--tRNA ligase-related protein, partial [Coprobacillus sp.]
MFEFMTVRELYEMVISGVDFEKESLEYVEVDGWIRSNRDNGKLGFIALNDGTYFKNTQVVYLEETIKNYDDIKRLSTGSAIRVLGKFKLTPDAKQPFEIEATEIVIEGECAEDFPLQKKRHSFEYMREIPHLRPRANTFYAIFRLRSVLSMAIHEFFQSQGFVYVHTPLITGNDGEGAGEMFRATTINDQNFEDDFFGKEAFLTVTGQLHVEAFCMAFRDVYTFGPAFRAENSNTSRHASEFWMIEPEIAFADLDDDMDLI